MGHINLLDVGKRQQPTNGVQRRVGGEAQQSGIIVSHGYVHPLSLPDDILGDRQIRIDRNAVEISHLDHQVSEGRSIILLKAAHPNHAATPL
ncbi:hypothetical protein MKK69_15970 [Methylobacterium sp. J-026]|uniref:hypothetical protein n=1 Tax=Methylobacterium sp. J-026 TaxID=2836624 RepID=UPI001FB8C6F2|nr:hypothetical protein [Methylobacterium sp. J-026]MCJ2135532.1 hypothetical protein [Methylobacterium sp. J-026]